METEGNDTEGHHMRPVSTTNQQGVFSSRRNMQTVGRGGGQGEGEKGEDKGERGVRFSATSGNCIGSMAIYWPVISHMALCHYWYVFFSQFWLI